MMLPLMRNPNTGSMLMILLLLKTTLVPCRGIYRMTYMSFLNGHQLMVLISMQKNVKPLRLISVEPHHIMLTWKSDLTSSSMLIKPKSWDSGSKTTWNGRPRWMLCSKKQTNAFSCLEPLKRFGFDQDELTVVYKSYVRPVIEYAYVVWHSGLTHKQAGDLERIQRRACRTILGSQFTTYTESIKQCNLERLSERRVDHCLKFAKGLVDN